MNGQTNNALFAVNAPRTRRPEKCDKSCIYFKGCRFPKNCPVLSNKKVRPEPLT